MNSYLGGTGEAESDRRADAARQVHDPTSNRMGGVAGHAGLFSTADDLAVFCQMILERRRVRRRAHTFAARRRRDDAPAAGD